MAFVAETIQAAFDTDNVKKGDLIRAQYYSWLAPVNGIITNVTDKTVTVLYMPKIHNACSYFSINAKEVLEGKWGALITRDMVTINEVVLTYGRTTEGELGSPSEEMPAG